MLRDLKVLSSIKKSGASGSSVTKNRHIYISLTVANKKQQEPFPSRPETYLAGVHI